MNGWANGFPEGARAGVYCVLELATDPYSTQVDNERCLIKYIEGTTSPQTLMDTR